MTVQRCFSNDNESSYTLLYYYAPILICKLTGMNLPGCILLRLVEGNYINHFRLEKFKGARYEPE